MTEKLHEIRATRAFFTHESELLKYLPPDLIAGGSPPVMPEEAVRAFKK